MPADMLIRLGNSALNFALPPRCPQCGVTVESNGRFCLTCWNQINFLGDPSCAGCGIPFAFERAEDALCAQCLVNRPVHDGINAVTSYDDISANIVMRLKYGGQLGLATLIAGHMARFISPEYADALIIPVPLHRRRIWSRGFNQSALIGQSLSALTGLKMNIAVLRRSKATPPLRGMNGKTRHKTVRGAFTLSKSAKEVLNNRRIILVDDVYTTGSTITACTKLLKTGGAQKVQVLVWARVLHGERE